jgi:hypothetical protein
MRPGRRSGPFTRKVTTMVEHGGGMYLAEVTLRCHPGTPGRTYGEPEDCYPPEPDMAEPFDILVVEAQEGGDPGLEGRHVDWEIDVDCETVHCAFEAQADADQAAYEDYMEAKLDAMREGD